MPGRTDILVNAAAAGVAVALWLGALADGANAQQGRPTGPAATTTPPGTAAPRPADAGACFSATDPSQIVGACDGVINAQRGAFTADQTGLALQRRAAARAALGRPDEAIADFRLLAATGHRAHEAHAAIGSIELGRRRHADAERAYREALRINPSYALAHIGLGHSLIALGRAGEAIAHFDQALATAASDAAAHLGKGTAQSAAGDLEGAIRSYDAALAIDARLLPALYQRAQAHHDRGDATRALRDADAAVAVAQGDERVRALTYRGRLRTSARQNDGAIADCTEAGQEADRLRIADDGRTRAAALVCLGLARQSKGDLAEAQESYERAIALDPTSATALTGRGYIVLQRGRYDAAIADFEAALRIDPRGQDAVRFLGLAHSDKGDRARAEAAFTRALEIDPRDPWPIMLRAIGEAREGDRDRALADPNRALGLVGERSSDGFLVRGAVHYLLEDMERARADLETALRLSPDNGQAHRQMARVHLRGGRLDEAQRALEAADRLLPRDPTVMLARGLLALARRDAAAAVREATDSLAISDGHAEAFVLRGQAYEAQGQTARAIAEYRIAEARLAIDPDGRRAKALATARLAALTGAPPAATVAQRREGGPAGAPASTAPAPAPVPATGGDASLYCKMVEGVLVHSRKYTGVAFDAGCGSGS